MEELEKAFKEPRYLEVIRPDELKFVDLVNGKRTRDKAYTFEELWWNGYYYAITRITGHTGTEVWLNDEGDGRVIGVEREMP